MTNWEVDVAPNGDRTYSLPDRPAKIDIRHHSRDSWVMAELVKSLGYRFVEYDLFTDTDVYAVPVSWWAAYKAQTLYYRARGKYVRWGLRWCLFHYIGSEAVEFRWRDLRPGPGKGPH